MDIKQVVGDNIKFIRYKRGYTLDDLSILTKMSRTHLHNIELAKYGVSVTKLEIIAKILKVEPHTLLVPDAYKTIE